MELSCQARAHLACQELQETCGFWAVTGRLRMKRVQQLPWEETVNPSSLQNRWSQQEIQEDFKTAINITLRMLLHTPTEPMLTFQDLPWSSLVEAKGDLEKIADILSQDSLQQHWISAFCYGNCQLLLRQARKPTGRRRLNNKPSETLRKDKSGTANSAYVMNSLADRFCQPPTEVEPGCSCGLKIYEWFRSKESNYPNQTHNLTQDTETDERLRVCKRMTQNRCVNFSNILGALFRVVSLPDPATMVDGPALLSLLFDKPCVICTVTVSTTPEDIANKYTEQA